MGVASHQGWRGATRQRARRRNIATHTAVVIAVRRFALLVLATACASASDPGELATDEPDVRVQGTDPRVPWAFIASSLGREILLHGYGATRAAVLRATLALAEQPHRSDELRASVRALADEAARGMPSRWEPAARTWHLTPMPPRRCARDVDARPRRHCTARTARTNEAAERERLLQIERELADDAARTR